MSQTKPWGDLELFAASVLAEGSSCEKGRGECESIDRQIAVFHVFHVFQTRYRPCITGLSEAEHQMRITGTPVVRNTFGVPRLVLRFGGRASPLAVVMRRIRRLSVAQ